MRFQTPLVRATLVRRYKRFLADARLEDGREVTAHCPNPGAMLGLKAPGTPIWLEPNDDPRRKLNYAWRLAELPGGHWAGIDAGLPNRVVAEALADGRIAEAAGYDSVRPEVKYGQKSRVDFLLTGAGRPDFYLEVKNVHLRRADDWAEFPDSVTARGARHMADLAAMAGAGHRAAVLYLVQRSDCARLRLAADLDPAYATAARAAREAGVEMLCYGTDISPERVTLADHMPVDLAPQP
ncbi:sugar fermentation stimulation protein A [Rhodovulum iodosum]|uniref:Sugar fermentation stimulation protein homolog n=1 Tax=Rhodovulum iodosum TaxID=68291 RepID=A0ABV3XQ99_9RHOB|nr:DNA/RNA nuclease SfsA [Rhodovulum robiginosum]RSK39419.1 DNA/RNA nuclease SfsA [Rhodovulum robiginosum]